MTPSRDATIPEYSGQVLGLILFDKFELSDHTHFVVAYSGGCDSQVLLDSLVSLREKSKIKITAAHFDHGLDRKAQQWVRQCESWCAHYGVEFLSARRPLNYKSGDSIEAKAREARYQWLSEVTSPSQVVLTAHHANDQAETFLLNLFQGKGISQLAGIASTRALARGSHTRIIRPLLEISKSQLLDYAGQKKLSWIDDPSNCNTRFYRNYLRQELMPELIRRRPSLVNDLVRAAHACQVVDQREHTEYQSLLLQCLNPVARGVYCLVDPINLSKLNYTNEYSVTGLIRFWLHSNGFGSPSDGKLNTLYHQIIEKKSRYASIKLNQQVVRYYHDHLYLTECLGSNSQTAIPWDLSDITIADAGISVKMGAMNSGGLDADRLKARSVSLVWRKGGERIRLKNRQHQSELKKLLQSHRTLPWERNNLPYLKVDDEIAWVQGLGTLSDFEVNSEKPGICPVFSRIND